MRLKTNVGYQEYKKLIAKGTDSLGQRERVALCLLCCYRLAPFYSEFSRTENWGDVTSFATCREKAVLWLRGETESLTFLREELDPHIPDMDDFGSALGSIALNAGCAHLDLIEQSNSDEPKPLDDALMMCYESVYFCIGEALDPEATRPLTDSEIVNHEMMSLEIDWQIEHIRNIRINSDLVQFVTSGTEDSQISALMAKALGIEI